MQYVYVFIVNLTKVLYDSFQTLFRKPKMFLPRLISTSISTLWVLTLPGFSPLGSTSVSLSSIFYYLVPVPLIMFLGVFVSVMLAEMVAEDPSLKRSFSAALNRWRTLLFTSIGLILATVLLYIPTALGGAATFLSGNFLFAFLGFVLSMVFLFGFSLAIFFLPVSLSEGLGVFDGFLNSVKTSRTNSFEVTALTLFGFVLLLAAFLMQGILQKIGVIGFVVSRFLSAVTTTYILVVSPKMYFSNPEN